MDAAHDHVIPAQAVIQSFSDAARWISACAGMTMWQELRE
jgi:hypothetical protein